MKRSLPSLFVIFLVPWAGSRAVDCRTAQAAEPHAFAQLGREEFIRLHGPRLASPRRVRAADFLEGRTHSEAIEAAQASRKYPAEPVAIVLDGREWRIDRAIVLDSNTELLIDGCTLKVADGVFDNVIRIARLKINPADPNGLCSAMQPVHDVKVTGLHGAVIEGPDPPRVARNPKTGVTEKWLGDFFGWRTIGIMAAGATRYEVCGLTMRKMQCWAISQEVLSIRLLPRHRLPDHGKERRRDRFPQRLCVRLGREHFGVHQRRHGGVHGAERLCAQGQCALHLADAGDGLPRPRRGQCGHS